MKNNIIIALLFLVGTITTGTVTYADTITSNIPINNNIQINTSTPSQVVLFSESNNLSRLSRQLLKFSKNEQMALENMTDENSKAFLNNRHTEISVKAKLKNLM